jgi:F420-0:gamma-glutamyl ligase
MVRTVGTTIRGIRTPIIKEGDDLANIVVDSLVHSATQENYPLNDGDIIGITESLVARAQGNYATLNDIATEINTKFSADKIAVLFPILSRNRFMSILQGILMSGKQVYLFLNYPADEVGNHLLDIDTMLEKGINPYTDLLTEEDYRRIFGSNVPHPFTGVDYVKLYKDLAIKGNLEIYLANDPRFALKYAKQILVANVHDRHRTKNTLINAGAEKVLGLDDLLKESVNGSGFNPEYGLLGSNKATETRIKLFPRDCQTFVNKVQAKMKEKTGKVVEVMVYGDGAYKDPYGKIWELADPVVCPGHTSGLTGTPNEVKLKYIADTELEKQTSADINDLIKAKIREKSSKGENLGTTPRKITDLLGSLCDLTSGSGDKGTPVILIQGYFDNYAVE